MLKFNYDSHSFKVNYDLLSDNSIDYFEVFMVREGREKRLNNLSGWFYSYVEKKICEHLDNLEKDKPLMRAGG